MTGNAQGGNFFSYKRYYFNVNCKKKRERKEKVYKWPPARLPESEIRPNLCLLVFFTFIFTLNVNTQFTVFIVYYPF